MTTRLRTRFRGPRAVAAELLHDAGEHVAATIKSTTATAGRAVVIGALAGLVIGAGLVWLGVSLGRQAT